MFSNDPCFGKTQFFINNTTPKKKNASLKTAHLVSSEPTEVLFTCQPNFGEKKRWALEGLNVDLVLLYLYLMYNEYIYICIYTYIYIYTYL